MSVRAGARKIEPFALARIIPVARLNMHRKVSYGAPSYFFVKSQVESKRFLVQTLMNLYISGCFRSKEDEGEGEVDR